MESTKGNGTMIDDSEYKKARETYEAAYQIAEKLQEAADKAREIARTMQVTADKAYAVADDLFVIPGWPLPRTDKE
jgi:hypothetical protein